MSRAAGLQRLSRLLFLQQYSHAKTPSLATGAGGAGRATSPAWWSWRPRAFATTPPAAPPPPRDAAPGKSPYDRWSAALRAAPRPAVALGALGVVPFVALATPVVKHVAWLLPHAVAERSELFQVGYGVAIASFLGGVHWGAALSSPLTAAAGPVAARMAAERLTWGVVPSLLAWPLVAMEPAPASALLSLLLPALYLVDARFGRRGLLPAWYMALRAPLTLGATFGCLLTATHHVHSEADRVAAAAAAAERAAAAAAAAAENNSSAAAPARK